MMNALVTNSMRPVPFHNDTVFLVENEGQPFVPVRPVVENLGLNWPSQYAKIKADGNRWGVVMIATPSGGGRQQSTCIPLRRFFGFLNSIEPSKVKPKIRAKLEMYQAECDEVLWKFWSGEHDQTSQDERLRLIIREELANYQPPSKAARPWAEGEVEAMKADILAGAQTLAVARKYHRAPSTVRKMTPAERATRNVQMGLFDN